MTLTGTETGTGEAGTGVAKCLFYVVFVTLSLVACAIQDSNDLDGLLFMPLSSLDVFSITLDFTWLAYLKWYLFCRRRFRILLNIVWSVSRVAVHQR